MPKKPTPVEERFIAKISSMNLPAEQCWSWGKNLDAYGYGKIMDGKRPAKAHRVSWEVHIGKIPEGMLVCHKCDNRACVNPAHLFLGTHKDNATDAAAKGRTTGGEKNSRAKLTWKDIDEICQSAELDRQLARRFGVSRPTINRARNGRTWRQANAD